MNRIPKQDQNMKLHLSQHFVMQCILYLINILEGTVSYIVFLDLFKSVVLFALIMCLSFFYLLKGASLCVSYHVSTKLLKGKFHPSSASVCLCS